MRNKDVYLVNRILFTKVEETMPRYCPTVCLARIEQPHYPIIVGDNVCNKDGGLQASPPHLFFYTKYFII